MTREVLGRAGTESAHAGERPFTAAGTTTVAVLAALVGVAAWTGFRALHNAPVELPGSVLGVSAWLGPVAGVLAGVAAAVLGLRSARPTERVGLLFAGVFGALGTVVGAVTIPAAVALVGGGAVALGDHRSDGGWHDALRRAIPGVLLVAVLLSLGGATGLLPSGARAAGSVLVVAGVAGSPLLVRPGVEGWTLGALAAGGVLWAGSALPFVTGAVTLVAFGLVATPLFVFATGVGGCVATVAGSLGRRGTRGRDERLRGVGAALVLLAAAPATVEGATAVVLGAALLAGIGTGGDRQ